VYDDRGSAKFDKQQHKLVVTLPVNYKFEEKPFSFPEPEVSEAEEEPESEHIIEPIIEELVTEPIHIPDSVVKTKSHESTADVRVVEQHLDREPDEIKVEQLPKKEVNKGSLLKDIEQTETKVETKPLPAFVTDTNFSNKYLTDID
jgi:hypothetical protein